MSACFNSETENPSASRKMASGAGPPDGLHIAINCVLLFSHDGNLVWESPTAGDFWKLSPENPKSANFDGLIERLAPIESSTSLSAAFDAALNTERSGLTGDTFTITAFDAPILLAWRLDRIDHPGRTPLVALSFQQLPQSAAAGETIYRETFDYVIEGLFLTTLDGQYVRANPSLATMYGYSSPADLVEALKNLDTQLYVKPGRRKEFVRLMDEQGVVIDFQSEVRRADGSVIWIAEFARTIYDARGNPLFYGGCVMDITDRRRAEQALRESEEKFRWLTETTSAVPWESKLDSNCFDYVGPQAMALLGFPIKEWLEPGFWGRQLHPEDRHWVPIVRGEAIAKGRPFELEYRMVRADGRTVWIREIMGFAPPGDNQPALGGFFLNVTHRRTAEDSLRESRLLIEQIASASAIILYAFDIAEQHCIFVDGRVRDILGYEKEALADMQPVFLLSQTHPDEIDESEAHLEKLRQARDQEVVIREFRMRKANGQWVWLCSRETVFKRSEAGAPLEIVGTAEDISEQVEATKTLIANEELFRRLVETTKVIPFEIDLKSGRFTYVGPQAENLFGYRLQDWYGKRFWRNAIHPEDAGKSFLERNLELLGEQDLQTDVRVRSANGAYLWVRKILHLSREQNLRATARGFLLDITEGKELEIQNEEAKRQLRALAQRNQTIREEERLSAAREIHDELGQALTIMKINLAWMTKRLTATDATSTVDALLDKIHSMEALADATLAAVRRIAAALRPPLLDELGLSDAIEWEAAEFEKRIGLQFELNTQRADAVSPEVATVVFRIFQEILTNIARHANATRVRISLFCDDQEVALVVSDNGRGICPEEQSRSPSFGILGMRERALAVGGAVKIQGIPGKGTTVSLSIPLNCVKPKYDGLSTE